MKRLYGAYGSNLNIEQMALRCLTAKVYSKGFINGYRLLFKGVPKNAYATIEPFEGKKVPVLIWELQEEDEEALDYYEGYPRFYEKEVLEVETESGDLIKVMVYIMTDKVEERIQLNAPSQRYLNSIFEGYKTAEFDTSILEETLKVSTSSGGENNG